MNCKNCGSSASEGDVTCKNCGLPLSVAKVRLSDGDEDLNLPNATTNWLSRRVQTNGAIWLLIALYQILVGIPLAAVGYGFVMIACGIWNMAQCIKDFRFAKVILACDNAGQARSIVSTIDQSKNSTVLFLFLNLFLGGVLGVIGCIYWLALRSKVLDRAPEMGVYN